MSEPPGSIPPMVHAVAEALRAACLKEYGSNWNYDVSWAFARAAIEAMREPTEAMRQVGGRVCDCDASTAHCAWGDLTSSPP